MIKLSWRCCLIGDTFSSSAFIDDILFTFLFKFCEFIAGVGEVAARFLILRKSLVGFIGDEVVDSLLFRNMAVTLLLLLLLL